MADEESLQSIDKSDSSDNNSQNSTQVYGNYANESGITSYEGNLESDVTDHREGVEEDLKSLESDIDTLKGAISASGTKPFGGYIPNGITKGVNVWIETQTRKHIADIRDKNEWYPPKPLQNDPDGGISSDSNLPQGPEYIPEVDASSSSSSSSEGINECPPDPNYSREDGYVDNTNIDDPISNNPSQEPDNGDPNQSSSDHQCSPDKDLYSNDDQADENSCNSESNNLECNPDDFNYSDECSGTESMPAPDNNLEDETSEDESSEDESSEDESSEDESSEDDEYITDYQDLFD